MFMNPKVGPIIEKVKEKLPIETIVEDGKEKEVVVFEKSKKNMEYMYLSAVSEMDYLYFSKLIDGYWDDKASLKQMIHEKDKTINGSYFNVLKGQIMTRSNDGD